MSVKEPQDPKRARLRRVEELFHAMLARPVHERATALAAACADDPSLAAEVQSLLDQPESAAGLFATPALEVAARAASEAGSSLLGRRLGAFEVQSLLGVGGMGEVYRGWDTRLGRAVAIKILPPSLRDDPDRGARFEREAHLLASLNHPNIGAVYGLEDADGLKALIMELVEGEDLSERLARGALPMAEALPIARQIAEAIEAAHERGVIHRDLKPANIKLRADGTVKVLDFGLAKALDPSIASSPDSAESPTLTARVTRMGLILGTPAYMAPEQALGKPVDRRADVWSFGVVLYEMLTGRRAFKGSDVPSTLAVVLSESPSFAALPASVPPGIRRLLERCLDRDPKTRLRDIGEARIELTRSEVGDLDRRSWTSSGERSTRGFVWKIAIWATLVAIVILGLRPNGFQPTAPESRLALPLGPGLQFPGLATYLAVAPDGRTIAFSATKGPGVGQQSVGPGDLYVRGLNDMTATPLGVSGRSPMFSPDGQWLAYSDAGRLKKIPVTGGAAIDIAALPASCDGDWGEDGTIVCGNSSDQPSDGIVRVAATGGPVSAVTSLDRSAGHTHHLSAQLLPGGRSVLFTIRSDGPKFQLAVTPISGGTPRILAEDALFGHYLGGGVLVFQRGGSLLVAPFDETRLELGEGTPVLSGVNLFWRNPAWAARNGVVVYRPEEDYGRTLLWVDREGRAVPVGAPVQPYAGPRLSPRGDRLSAIVGFQTTSDVWTFDLGSRRLQREMTDARVATWAPDGSHLLVHRRSASSEILSLRLDGSGFAEPLVRGQSVAGSAFLTKDGRTLVYHELTPSTGYDLMAMDLQTKAVRPLVRTPKLEAGARLHPSGRWMAYASDLNGRDDVFVTPFPEAGVRIPVTLDGGREPVWSRDGRELFYRKGNQMFSAKVRPGASLAFDPPRLLFDVAYYQDGGPGSTQYDVAPDGRFLMMRTKEKETPFLGIVLNWSASLRRAIGRE